MEHCDIAIIGGGMVGALAAALLAPTGLNIRVIEAKAPAAFSPEQAPDLRVSAISATSVRLLQQAGAWEAIVAMRAWPYQRLEACEWQGFSTHFEARELGCEYLGYMVENRVIQLGLWQALAQLQNVLLDCPNGLTDLTQNEAVAELSLEGGQRLQARLVLACDGAESRTRQLAGIGISSWDYAQHCMLIGIEGDGLEPDTTWQQFVPSGPRAFLPMGPLQGSLVWYDQKARIAELAALDNASLAEQVAAHFPARLGNFKVLSKGHFPLRRRHANDYVKGAVVLLGDAAHTINPLAGQGVNLGFKDVAALSELIHQGLEAGLDIAATERLLRYQRRRRPDNLLMQSAMDLCYHTFSNDIMPIKLLRNLGLKAAQHSGPLKTRVMKYAMGL
ncbi:FAD-dependent monooxygenase [Oceanisphaera arctica]|uniref:2-octaprenyl-3-methyl-6-methoxy-1,4-benzoquinol hydroxylase n=1 Tax=Oceanisphaera arctica TaxID=641510 RepID=A0A2P5TL01_9GAMM|nr:FAD-dependent monooxygenase [Oceanisphaera arctica]PPL15913.1 2-octaprenyl-3-methyl-6-methoxy-1,4-benzoquinol hydroxylase [Oceanisphaera arctica]GHA26742.1 2-octaprenyl-3-methyl-6-methoxy-1,4-benzoquinol hydroxylase [Oceanisphaera arctica]